MSEGYKPSEEGSNEKEDGEMRFSDKLRYLGSRFHFEVQKPLDSLFGKFDRVVETNSALPDSIKGGSPELMRDVETAKRIQLEITEKLKELEGLKFGATE